MERTAAIVVFLFLIGLLPVIWPMPSLAAAVLTAPCLLLLPTGLGLAAAYGVLGRQPTAFSALQTLLIAYFAGLFLFILVFVAAERFSAEPIRPGLLMAVVWGIALLGWLRMRCLIDIPREERRLVLVVVAIALLLGAVRYVYTITIYSDYPVTDLFQRTQFHGGAWAFARTLVLNPFVAGSYIPFQQLQLGLLLRLAGVDPLVAEWVWPAALAPLQVGVLYAFFSRILVQRLAAVLALSLALAQSGLSNPTNGTIAELATITVLSLLLMGEPGQPIRGKAIALRFFALATGIVLGFALLKMPLGASGVAALALVSVAGLLASGRRWGLAATIAMLAAITLPFHRGALLYLILGGATVAAYSCFVLWQEKGGETARRLLRWLLAAVLAVAGGMTVRILVMREDETDAFGLWRMFDLILMPFAGKSMTAVAIDGDLAPGAGARVALFELARAVSPLVVGVAVGAILLFSLEPLRRRLGFLDSAAGREAFAQVLVFIGITSLILTGFPFIHRSGFLVVLFASAAAINVLLSTRLSLQVPRLLALAFAAYAVFIVGLAFAVASAGIQPYLHRAVPAFAMLGAALAALALLPAAWRGRHGWRTGAVLVLAVAAEVALSKTYFKPYAFRNQIPPSSRALASFDAADLRLSAVLASRTNGSEVLVSDPKMMTFLRARTGLYPFLSSSNLDTIDAAIQGELVSLLRAMTSGEPGSQSCRRLAEVLEAGGSGIYSYAAARRRPGVDGRTVLAALGYNDRLMPTYDAAHAGRSAEVSRVAPGQRYVIIIDRTTLDWLGKPGSLSYFPVHGTLPATVVANLDRAFPVHHVFQDTYIAELECP